MATEQTDSLRLFQQLSQLVPALDKLYTKGVSEIPKGDPLYLDIHTRYATHTVVFLGQYYRSSDGDWIPVPEFEIAIYPAKKAAEALACYEPDRNWRVHGKGGKSDDVSVELNALLSQWLGRWLGRGHCIRGVEGCQGRGGRIN